jgi:hypothetical protein
LRVRLARTLTTIALFAAAAACGRDYGTGPGKAPLGQFAGGNAANDIDFIIFSVEADGATFRDNAACIFGEIEQPLTIDAAGKFSASATLRRMAGDVAPAKVDGTFHGDQLLLRLDIGGTVRQFDLRLNAPIPQPRIQC